MLHSSNIVTLGHLGETLIGIKYVSQNIEIPSVHKIYQIMGLIEVGLHENA